MTDEHVDRLIRDADPYRPGVIGRLDGAEQILLEEIMSNPVPRHALSRRLVGAVAAAAVLVVILGIAAVQRRHADDRPTALPATTSTTGPATGAPGRFSAVALEAAEQNPRLLVKEPGWKVTSVYGFAEKSGTIAFANGDKDLEMNWYPAGQYDGYYSDRLEVSAPQAAAVDGWPGNLFTYSASDFAIMLRPRDGVFVELRATGSWTRADFNRVVAGVKRVDVDTWLAALPPEIVTPGKVQDAADALLADVPIPPGFDKAALDKLGTNDPYQFGAEVSKRIGCGWIAEWARAKKAGDQAAVKKAQDAMASSHHWKFLQPMVDEGDWAEAFWEIADVLAAGRMPQGYQSSLECQ